jgi:hypothetical protein
MAPERRPDSDEKTDMPEYLGRWPGLFMRKGDAIVEALPEDIEVATNYPAFRNKGHVLAGRRITIMSRKTTYHIGEAVRVLHVLEVLEPGHSIFVMGPKTVFDEYVDDCLVTEEYPEEEQVYDGRVLPSPGVDYNYDITTYSFEGPGRHTIYWQMGEMRSNTLELEIIPPT